MWERVLQMIRKELRQLLRHPRMRVALFGPPVVQLLVFGYAVNLDVDNVRIAWMDQDRTPASRDLRAAFEGSGRFQVAAFPDSEAAVQRLLDGGEVQAVIRLLPGFAADLARSRPAAVQLLIDGTNSNSASLISSYASQIVAGFSAEAGRRQQESLLLARLGTGTINLKAPRLIPRPRVWFNPDLRSRNYFVPGVIVNIILIVTVMLTAMAIVREKEIGTMEQLMVTPIRPVELMIGKTVPFALVGLMELVLVTTAALLVFHVPFRGGVLVLLVSAVFFLLTSLGAGLLISTISGTQQQALISSFLVATPVFMLSGFAFPIRNMPVVIQYLTYLNPLRYFLEIVRDVFLKGTGAAILWPQMSILAVFGVAVIGISSLRFRKSLD